MPIFNDKYTPQSTAFNDKFSSPGTIFADRFSPNTEYLATQALEQLITESGEYLVSKGQTFKDKFV